MTNTKFITIEGTEGAGKSTALNIIAEFFDEAKLNFVITREPGGTEIAEEIRKILLFPRSKELIESKTELLLMFAGRAQHISQVIVPALKAGQWVISDRYVDASYAYQGGGREINIKQIKLLDEFIVGELYPGLTLLLDVPAEIGLERTLKRLTVRDRIEKEKINFFERVRNVYLERANQDPGRMKIIDASQTLPKVKAQIYNALVNYIGVSK